MFEQGIFQWRNATAGQTFSVVIAGDCCPRERGEELLKAGKAASIVEEVKPFFDSSDLKLIQWETPLTCNGKPIDKSGPNLNCDPACVALAQALGIDIALTANNHIADQGTAATLETLEHLKAAGLQTVGAGRNLEEAERPLTLTQSGLRVAILNFAENEFGTATKVQPGFAPLSPLKNLAAIKQAKNESDMVIVAIHGGHEANPFPSPRMVETYRAFADAGASLVFNCHTHCPEGIELWNGVPIVYCPGNFYFPSAHPENYLPVWWTGYLPKFYCDARGVYALELEPYYFDNDRIHVLPPEGRRQFFDYMEEISLPLGDAEQLQRNFEAWCTQYGAGYLKGSVIGTAQAGYPADLQDRTEVKRMLPLRNIFTCESHHDLIRQLLRLIEEYRVEEAQAYLPRIAACQRPPWMSK